MEFKSYTLNLAQFNIAEAKLDDDSPEMQEFFSNVERINAAADRHPGFVWRLTDAYGNASSSIRPFSSEFILVNMSVWKDRESLFDYVYKSEHLEIYKRKKEWFRKMPKMHMVMWYVEEGHIPTLDEGMERLDYLNEHGETPHAFTFKSNFKPVED